MRKHPLKLSKLKKRPNTNQQGAAIIVALFVTALIATAGIAMMENLSIDTRRTELLLNNTKANLYAEGSIAWAKDQLINDLKLKQPNKIVDHTPIFSTINEINGAKISASIEDAQGKLNLNNLTDPLFQQLFISLLQIISPDINASKAQTITRGVVDWITLGIQNSNFDHYYAKLNPAYRSPHKLMANVSELRLIQGMTPALYNQLLPYVIALPDTTNININNAPIQIIMSFAPTIKIDTVKAFDSFRRVAPLTNLDKLANFAEIKNSPVGKSKLTVTSDFFLVKTNVTISDQHVVIYSLMKRFLKNQQPFVQIISQSKGTL